MEITKLEAQLINRIVHDLYQPTNGGEPESFEDLSDIWAFMLETKSDGGVFASLQKKGLAAYSSGGTKDEDTICLTPQGWDVYVSQIKK